LCQYYPGDNWGAALTEDIMQSDERKAAVAAYRERKPAGPGIYAVKCVATGQWWVGRAPNIAAIENRLWFSLRHGSGKPASLQAAWTAHGADGLALEALETFDEEEASYGLQQKLKARLAFWAAELKAETI
jgi:hypothetical protein